MRHPLFAALYLIFMHSPVTHAAAESAAQWYASGKTAVAQRAMRQHNTKTARNVILFIGDGMGISTVTAGRIYAGQNLGKAGEEHNLAFDRFAHLALVKTYNTNQQVPDSAGTASAMHTGVKTRAGVIGIAPQAHRRNCAEAQTSLVTNLGEIAEQAGKATGVVTTARLTHATPAALYAHTPERDWEADSEVPRDAKAQGCRPIARQLIEFNYGDGIDVAMGGGRGKFSDKLISKWKRRFPDGKFIEDRAALATLNEELPVLGLFNRSHMTYMLDRKQSTAEPTLSEMTRKAIQLLEQRPNGYYLLVEGGRIDHAHHAGIAGKALAEVEEFSRAVQTALDEIDLAQTLVLVTADHSHVLTIAGYPTRGNPILGLVVENDRRGEPLNRPALARDGKPYATLGYQNGPGAVSSVRAAPQIGPTALQQAAIPTSSETHAGEDVALYATGPWSHLVDGVMEQHEIFHVIRYAFGWRD